MKDKIPKDVLTKSYEDLRDFMVGHKMTLAPPRGLALFLRQGMPGWIEAWSKLASSDQATPFRPQPLEVRARYAETLPFEAAAILANMALAAVRRENP
jgi:hypothetical protein